MQVEIFERAAHFDNKDSHVHRAQRYRETCDSWYIFYRRSGVKIETFRKVGLWRRTGFVDSKIPEVTDLQRPFQEESVGVRHEKAHASATIG
jgi:hypothetical protein